MDFIKYIPAENESSYETDDEHDYGEIQMLVDYDLLPSEATAIRMQGVVYDLVIGMSAVKIDASKKYKKYGSDQIKRFISIMQEEGKTVPVAAKICEIPRSTAYEIFHKFNETDGTSLPSTTRKTRQAPPKKLFPEHTVFMVKLLDENPSATLGLLSDELKMWCLGDI